MDSVNEYIGKIRKLMIESSDEVTKEKVL